MYINIGAIAAILISLGAWCVLHYVVMFEVEIDHWTQLVREHQFIIEKMFRQAIAEMLEMRYDFMNNFCHEDDILGEPDDYEGITIH